MNSSGSSSGSGSSSSGSNITLDSRLLSAMKRLRMENIQLSKQLKALQEDFGNASSEATDSAFRTRDLELQLGAAQQQLQEMSEMKLRMQSLETSSQQWESQRAATTQLVQRQAQELQELRVELHRRNEEIARTQVERDAALAELEEVKSQARDALSQQYDAMKTAQEQAQDAFEEARRSKSQLDAIRPPANGLRKVLPPRSLFPQGGK